MKLKRPLIWMSMLMMMTVSGVQGKIFQHPHLEFYFEASEGWQIRPRTGDPGTLQVVNDEETVTVMLWYTSTESAPRARQSSRVSIPTLPTHGTST